MRGKLTTTLKVTAAFVLSIVLSGAPLTPAYAYVAAEETTPTTQEQPSPETVQSEESTLATEPVESTQEKMVAPATTNVQTNTFTWPQPKKPVSPTVKVEVPCSYNHAKVSATVKVTNVADDLGAKGYYSYVLTGAQLRVDTKPGEVANGESKTFSINNLPVGNYELSIGGFESFHYVDAKVKFSVKKCVEIELPQPHQKDPCGKNNAYWFMPKNNDEVTWELNQQGELVATTKPGYVFPGGVTTHNYGAAKDSGKLCKVWAHEPKFFNACGDKFDWIKLHQEKGVVYKVNGTVVTDWFYHVTTEGTVTVTAEAANDDYELLNKKTSWSYEYPAENCLEISKYAEALSDTNGDGMVGVGDTVTWHIKVTNNADNWFEKFDVEVVDNEATIQGDATFTLWGKGDHEDLVATSVITVENLGEVCGVTNTASFTAKRAHKYSQPEIDIQSLRSIYQPEVYTGSDTATAAFNCPGGAGGDTPQVLGTTTTTLPKVLPATGSSTGTSPLLLIAASLIAFGAAYFIQGRRILARNRA